MIHASWLLQLLTGRFARAIALYPFIFVRVRKDKQNIRLVNHERIHLRQQAELWVIPFYLCYVYEYFYHRFRGLGRTQAYLAISFEREAYENEGDMHYLAHRPRYAFRAYKCRTGRE